MRWSSQCSYTFSSHCHLLWNQHYPLQYQRDREENVKGELMWRRLYHVQSDPDLGWDYQRHISFVCVRLCVHRSVRVKLTVFAPDGAAPSMTPLQSLFPIRCCYFLPFLFSFVFFRVVFSLFILFLPSFARFRFTTNSISLLGSLAPHSPIEQNRKGRNKSKTRCGRWCLEKTFFIFICQIRLLQPLPFTSWYCEFADRWA